MYWVLLVLPSLISVCFGATCCCQTPGATQCIENVDQFLCSSVMGTCQVADDPRCCCSLYGQPCTTGVVARLCRKASGICVTDAPTNAPTTIAPTPAPTSGDTCCCFSSPRLPTDQCLPNTLIHVCLLQHVGGHCATEVPTPQPTSAVPTTVPPTPVPTASAAPTTSVPSSAPSSAPTTDPSAPCCCLTPGATTCVPGISSLSCTKVGGFCDATTCCCEYLAGMPCLNNTVSSLCTMPHPVTGAPFGTCVNPAPTPPPTPVAPAVPCCCLLPNENQCFYNISSSHACTKFGGKCQCCCDISPLIPCVFVETTTCLDAHPITGNPIGTCIPEGGLVTATPTAAPTAATTSVPTSTPTASPTASPTATVTTSIPTTAPTPAPTVLCDCYDASPPVFRKRRDNTVVELRGFSVPVTQTTVTAQHVNPLVPESAEVHAEPFATANSGRRRGARDRRGATLSRSFAASNDLTQVNNNAGGTYRVPGNPSSAANDRFVLSLIDSFVAVYDKATSAFFTGAPARVFFQGLSPTTSLTDPKAIYDQFNNQFVMTYHDRDGSCSATSSKIMVGVNWNDDLIGVWNVASILSTVNIGGTLHFAENPGIAVDANYLYITADMYSCGHVYGGSRVWVVDKVPFFQASIQPATVVELDPYGSSAGIKVPLQPAHIYGESGFDGTWLVGYSGLSVGSTEFARIIKLSNPFTAPVFTELTDVSLGNVDDTSVTQLPGLSQVGTTIRVGPPDRRTLQAVWRNNQLVFTSTVAPPSRNNRSTAIWIRYNTSSDRLIDRGALDADDISPQSSTAYASVAMDARGGIVFGFTASSPTMSPGAFYTHRLDFDPLGTTRDTLTLQLGLDVYDSATPAWGHYSSTSFDPINGCFWLHNMHSALKSPTSSWATHIGATCLFDSMVSAAECVATGRTCTSPL